MIFDKDKDVLDQQWFTLKQVGVFLLALLAIVIPWTWRVATTHHEFLLLKETQALEKKFQDEQNILIKENHEKDIMIDRLQAQEADERLNSRLDKKTQRNAEAIDAIEKQIKELKND